jgi:DNA-binding NarL/FixJ family response regulator
MQWERTVTASGRSTRLNQAHVTPRQADILELVADGLADKEIAARLGLSYGTVRTQLGRFFTANGVRDRAGAAALWVRTSDRAGR